MDTKERLLIDIVGFLGGPQEVKSKAENLLVVGTDEFLECRLVTSLCGTDQGGFVHNSLFPIQEEGCR